MADEHDAIAEVLNASLFAILSNLRTAGQSHEYSLAPYQTTTTFHEEYAKKVTLSMFNVSFPTARTRSLQLGVLVNLLSFVPITRPFSAG